MKKKFFEFMLVFLLSLFFQSNIYATTTTEWKAGCEPNFPPFNYIMNGKNVGLDTEIVQLVASKMGVSLNLDTYPWARVVNLLEKNYLNIAWQFVDTEERRRQFNLAGPIRDGKTVFMVSDKSPLNTWNQFEDFKGKTIGVVRGFKYTPEFDNFSYFNKVVFNNNQELVKNLLNSKIDVIIGDAYALTYQLKLMTPARSAKILTPTIKIVPRYIGFPKSQNEEAERFQKTLDFVKNTPEYKKIIQKYATSIVP